MTPNLVLIVVDTLRFDAAGAEDMPALAALGDDGVVFSRSFSHAPMTLPSHTALFTSRYPHDTGVVVNGQVVPKDLLLLPEWLGQLGYRTLAVTSLATLWRRETGTGLDQGFDDFRHAERDYSDGMQTADVLAEQLAELDGLADAQLRPLFIFAQLADPHEPYRDFARLGATLEMHLDDEVRASVNARTAPHVRFNFDLDAGIHTIEIAAPDENFVLRSLYVYVRNRGRELRVPIEYIEGRRLDKLRRLRVRFELPHAAQGHVESWVTDHPSQAAAKHRYRDEVQRADRALARIIDELKAQGLYDSSLVIFTSDHGEAFGEHRHNGHSQNLFDELLHVPLVIKPPAGPRFDDVRHALRASAGELVRHVDLAPTALDILGLPPLAGAEGSSLLDAHAAGRVLVAETHRPEAERDLFGLRDGSFKLIFGPEDGHFQLFNLGQDPGELTDVFESTGAKFGAWQQRLRALATTWERRSRPPGDTQEANALRALGY